MLSLAGRCCSRRLERGGAAAAASFSTKIENGKLIRSDPSKKRTNGDGNDQVKILHVNAANSKKSLVATCTEHLLSRLTFPYTLHQRDLWPEPSTDGEEHKQALISYDVSHVAAKMRLLKGKGSEEDEKLFRPVLQMADELNKAQILIVSTPIWNFSFPYVVKQYIDIVLQPGINFIEEPGALPRPVISDPNKILILVTSSGGTYGEGSGRPNNHLSMYLTEVFHMVGFQQSVEIAIQGAMQRPRPELELWSKTRAEEISFMLNEHY